MLTQRFHPYFFIQRRKLRIDHQVLRAWPVRVQRLISENACHSDDEDAPGGEFYILYMASRSEKTDKFVRDLDVFITTSTKFGRRKNVYKRIDRILHPDGRTSDLDCLPSPKVALDWHDPHQFNLLPAHIRARYRKSPIALPLEEDMMISDAWKDLKMSDEQFMRRFGDRVRAQYHFPTKEEIYAMKRGVLPHVSDDESGSEGNDTVRGASDDDWRDLDADFSENDEGQPAAAPAQEPEDRFYSGTEQDADMADGRGANEPNGGDDLYTDSSETESTHNGDGRPATAHTQEPEAQFYSGMEQDADMAESNSENEMEEG